MTHRIFATLPSRTRHLRFTLWLGLAVTSLSLSANAAPEGLPFAPTIFAPSVISGPANDASPAFSPDGKTVFFTRGGAIVVSHLRRGRWSKPETASFSGKWRDCEPAMAPDGSFLILAGSRPTSEGGAVLDGTCGGHIYKGNGGNLWRVGRKGDGWESQHD